MSLNIMNLIALGVNIPKEEKLNFLTNKIWQTLYESDSTNKLESLTFHNLIIEYLKTSFDLDNVNISFKNLPKTTNGYSNPEGITLNRNKFMFDDTPEENYKNIARFIKTLSHELAHQVDDASAKKNKIEFDTRFPHGNGYKMGILALANIFPNKKQLYEEVGHALYIRSCNEFYARKIGYAMSFDLINKLNKLTEQKYPLSKNYFAKKQIYDNLINQNYPQEQALELVSITKSDLKAFEMKSMLSNIANNLNNTRIDYNILMNYATTLEDEKIKTVKKDFLQVCNNFLDPNCTNPNIRDYDPFNMAVLLTKPEFFDKATAQKLYLAAKKENVISVLGELSKLQELKLSKEERKNNIQRYQQYMEDYFQK